MTTGSGSRSIRRHLPPTTAHCSCVSQGWRMNGAIKTTERKLAEGGMEHGSTGLMAWAVGNARIEPKGNAISITKQTSGSAKIDPLMATFNAVELMSRNPQASGNAAFFGFLAARREAAEATA